MMKDSDILQAHMDQPFDTLDLLPEDVFVFSRINGQCSVGNIISLTGLESDKVRSIVEKLISLQVVSVVEDSKESKKKPEKQKGSKSMIETLDEEDRMDQYANVPRHIRQKILLMFDDLQKKTWYEIFEISKSAGKDEVQQRYLKLVKTFHPDRFFGKDLGPYQHKLEAVFQAVQMGYETLIDPKRRKSYDAQKQSVQKDAKHQRGDDARPVTDFNHSNAFSNYQRGMKEEKLGNFKSARNFYRLAVQLDSQESEYQRALDRLEAHKTGSDS
ncbi:MAG: DnaJ domain-containing protein [Bdellovibrionales bacterium]|nr:DnaJ domain-containing protein [Bdellovibrionales bacterium]